MTYSDNSTFFNINSTTGKISFTPTDAEAGTHKINISVSDGALIDYEIVTFKIGNFLLELFKEWNLISTPFVENDTIQSIFDQLSNGNWGCGRGGNPLVCDASDGDFVGNFTKLMGYNKSAEAWIMFNPTDFYLSIPHQDLLDIDPLKGYWIHMSVDQNVTLVIV